MHRPSIPDNAIMHMFGLYGDQRYNDPLMQHKWCYCSREMIHILDKCGYSDIERLPAQFHKKELRDMRVEAVK